MQKKDNKLTTSILFIMINLLGICGFYLFPKNKSEPLNGTNWICISIVLWMCIHIFTAAIINLIHIPINLVSFCLIDMIIGGCFWFINLKNRRLQKYFFHPSDIFLVLLFLITVIALGRWQFSSSLNIRYETSDPSMHFQFAREIIDSQEVSGMFFTPLINAFFLEIFSPFILTSKLYKVFILFDIGMLFLSAFVFYITIDRYLTNWFMKITGAITGIVYVLAYPLNNMVFGFFYLGIGVTLICSLLFMFDSYTHNELDKNQDVIFIGLINLGIVLCYSLFAPVVYLSVFFFWALLFRREKQIISLRSLATIFITLLLPGVIGIYYGYFSFFGDDGITATQAIQIEGYIYRDLFSNFLIFLPFAIYGALRTIKDRRINLAVITVPILGCYMLILFFGALHGKVSSYYYYKNYYLLWMIIFYLLVCGVYYLSQKEKNLIVIYFAIWAAVAVINFSGIENKIYTKNYLVDPVIKSSVFFDIYNFNKFILDTRPFYDNGKIELYKYVYTNLVDQGKNNSRVPFAGDWLDCYWYEAITNQIGGTSRYWVIGDENFIGKFKNGDLGDYIVVLYDGELYKKYGNYFNQLKRIYANSSGFISIR